MADKRMKVKKRFGKSGIGIILLLGISLLLASAGVYHMHLGEERQQRHSILAKRTVQDMGETVRNGAAHSVKKSIQSEMTSGDFSHLNDDNWEYMQKQYERCEERGEPLEWRQIDLNGDGIEDLILQEGNTVTEEVKHKRIVGIFACEEDEAKCVLWDVNDCTEYYYCGPTGELMYYYDDYGRMVSFEGYYHVHYDMEWNRITDDRLQIFLVDSPEGYDYPEEWFAEHPDMQEEGVYFRKYTGAYTGEETDGEVLTFEEFKELYKAETGLEFYSHYVNDWFE